jgi:hypothetical protein
LRAVADSYTRALVVPSLVREWSARRTPAKPAERVEPSPGVQLPSELGGAQEALPVAPEVNLVSEEVEKAVPDAGELAGLDGPGAAHSPVNWPASDLTSS